MALVNNEPLTAEKIEEALREYDLIIRPKALVVSPKMKKALLEAEPTIEQRVVLVESYACEDETAYLIDRKEIEKYVPVPLLFESEVHTDEDLGHNSL